MTDKKLHLDVTAPGEKLLDRLFDTLAQKGIGGLLRPWQERRVGRAQLDVQTESIRAIAQAEHDAAEILAGRMVLGAGGKLLLNEGTAQPAGSGGRPEDRSAAEIAAGEMFGGEMRRQVNVARALLKAGEQLESDPTPPPEQHVDEDWLFRWRDAASQVSSEDLQHLWGRVLAGEVKAPGTVSLRTLEFLRNLSQNEALEVEQALRFAISEIIFRDLPVLEEKGLHFGQMLHLQNLGVVYGAESMGLNRNWASTSAEDFIAALYCHGQAMVIRHPDPTRTLEVTAYFLTDVAVELLEIGSYTPDEDYLNAITESLKRQGYSVSRGTVVGKENGKTLVGNLREL